MRTYCVYIITNKNRGVLYIGVTNDIVRRIWEHKEKKNESFSSKYRLTKLVYYKSFESILEAISYEKRLKGWRRNWKIEMIEKDNPTWVDLYEFL